MLFSKKRIVKPDKYTKKYIDLTQKLMSSDIALQRHCDSDIAAFFPLSTNDEMCNWIYRQVFYSTMLPCMTKGSKLDEYYHISHSRYALFDFTIFAYFNIRRLLCQCVGRADVDKSDSLFFDFIIKFFDHYFSITEKTANKILDLRLEKYEKVMRENRGEKTEEFLNGYLYSFIINDFHKKMLSDMVFIESAHISAALNAEICSLMVAYYKLISKNLPSFI